MTSCPPLALSATTASDTLASLSGEGGSSVAAKEDLTVGGGDFATASEDADGDEEDGRGESETEDAMCEVGSFSVARRVPARFSATACCCLHALFLQRV